MHAVEHITTDPSVGIEVEVRVANRSRFWLSSDYDAIPIFVGHRWTTPEGAAIGPPVLPGALPADNVHDLGSIPPGGEALVCCRVTAPSTPGRYVLRLGVVQTQFLWIDEIDPKSGARVHVDVRPV